MAIKNLNRQCATYGSELVTFGGRFFIDLATGTPEVALPLPADGYTFTASRTGVGQYTIDFTCSFDASWETANVLFLSAEIATGPLQYFLVGRTFTGGSSPRQCVFQVLDTAGNPTEIAQTPTTIHFVCVQKYLTSV